MKKTLFISDLHLEEKTPQTTALFLKLLDNCDREVDALYILGDLFEAWIGDDDDSPFVQSIISSIKKASDKGLKIYLMRGNRDFLYGKRIEAKAGVSLLPDEACISLYGKHVLLMHGDTLCTRDTAYLEWRKKARNRFLHTVFFLSLPLSIRRKIADMLRKKSSEYSRQKPEEMMDVTQEEVERLMQKHQVNDLIHGHTHRPGIHQFNLNAHPSKRIVLGAWHDAGSVLVWDEMGRKELQIIH